MKYQIFQNRSIERSLDSGTRNCWEALNLQPGVTEYMTVSAAGSTNWDADKMSKYWDHVADIYAGSLEEVFSVGNIGPESVIVRYARMSSVSVGNIVVNSATGQAYMVDKFGFANIDFYPELKMGALAYAL